MEGLRSSGGLASALTSRSHRLVDLSEPLDDQTPHSPSHPAFGFALIRRHGDRVRADGGSSAFEMISTGGHTGTHVDAPVHASLDGRLYGGMDAAASSQGGRFSDHAVDTIGPFLCRGVMIDIPRWDGVDAVDCTRRISASDLEGALRRQGQEVHAGDAVLIRTGRPLGRFADIDHRDFVKHGVPGPDDSAARWMARHRVAVAGSDTLAFEWLAPTQGLSRLPAHSILLVEHGIPIIEFMNLEELARSKTWEFVLIGVPLRIVGGTGSPMRPLALVGG